jgi:hypothetical protein
MRCTAYGSGARGVAIKIIKKLPSLHCIISHAANPERAADARRDMPLYVDLLPNVQRWLYGSLGGLMRALQPLREISL